MSSLSFGNAYRNLQNWGNGISTVASTVLPFDPTPGFNLTTHTGSGVPFAQRTPSTNAGQTSSPNRVANTGQTDPTAKTSTYDASQSQAAAQAAQERQGIESANAAYDTQLGSLRGMLGQVGTTREQGLQQLSDSYNTEKQQGLQKYGQQRDDNSQNRLKALDGVATKARTGFNSLRSLLGLSGSANQSAAGVASNAVARQASQDRQGQIDTYGRNERDVTNAETGFVTSLDTQRKERERNFLQGLLEQENDINSKIGDVEMRKAQINGSNYQQMLNAYAPYQSAIDSTQSKINGLYDQYKTPFNAEAKLAQTSQFNIDPTAIKAEQQGGQSEYSPFSQFLRKKLTGEAA